MLEPSKSKNTPSLTASFKNRGKSVGLCTTSSGSLVAAFPKLEDLSDRHSSPSLDYYNMLYMELLIKTTWKLQLVQNAATWAMIDTPGCAYVTTLLQKLP